VKRTPAARTSALLAAGSDLDHTNGLEQHFLLLVMSH